MFSRVGVLVSAVLFFPLLIQAQSSVIIRNSTKQEFKVVVQQFGSHQMELSEWEVLEDTAKPFIEGDSEIFQTERTSAAVPTGDTIYFDIALQGNTDTLTVHLRMIGISGGSEMDYSISGPGFSEAWYDDGNFHELQTTLAGKDVIIKYKPDNNDNSFSRDIRFAIHTTPIYEIDQADFENPNVLNVMAYNVQMLPFGVTGLPQASDRAALLPAHFSPYQDVIVFAEVFDDAPREDDLEPAMLAAGFPYKTTILNDPGGGFLPWNGGVMIFSRWPIENTAEYDFELCGQAAQDCLANKGIKYASINKMGKRYHIFGTHMDAGGQQDDYDAKLSQIGEMRRFILEQNIPAGDAVVFGGDFNIAPIDEDSLYFNFLDSLQPVIPIHIGEENSNFSERFGNIIDHVWGDGRFLLPLTAINDIATFRSLDPVLWDLSEFSDHKCALGRFTYPDISSNGRDTVICPGEDLNMAITTSFGVDFQWYKDGQEIPGATSGTYSLSNAVEAESGHYECRVNYQRIYGNTTGDLIPVFFPYGPDTINANLMYDMGQVTVDSILCQVGINETKLEPMEIFPNPNNGQFRIELPDGLNAQAFSLEVYNSLGEQVWNGNIKRDQQTLNLSELGSGIYFIRISGEGYLLNAPLVIH